MASTPARPEPVEGYDGSCVVQEMLIPKEYLHGI